MFRGNDLLYLHLKKEKPSRCESGRELLLPADVGGFFISIFVHPCVLRVAEENVHLQAVGNL